MMELTLLTVPACPSAAQFEERLAAALAAHPDVVVQRREIADEREAAEAGMHGSPTLLIDGVDPFPAPGQLSSLSCRLYRDPAGHADGAPPLDALRQVLEQASAHG
jgi:predicted DsbA family dithiol-disulfide isomerase